MPRSKSRSWLSEYYSRVAQSLVVMVMIVVSCQFQSNPSWAQSDVASRIPKGSSVLLSVWPKQLFARDSMKLAPIEVLQAAGLENLGMDPLKIERIDLVVGAIDPASEPQFAFLVKMVDPVDVADLKPQLFREPDLQVQGDYEYYALNAPTDFHLHMIDDQHALIGTADLNMEMASAQQDDPRLGRLASAAANGSQDAMVLIDVGVVSPLLDMFIQQQLSRELPANIIQDLTTIVENTEFLALSAEMGSTEKLKLVILGTDEEAATRSKQSVEKILGFAADAIVGEAKREMPADSLVGKATHQYIDRMAETIMGSLTPEQNGARLVLEIEDLGNPALIGSLTGLLLPAVQQSRVAARRVQASNNMRQLGLALHNFASAYNAFPSTAALDENDKPMLSWRVAILPFIEQQELFQEFNLDEPWDSENNLALLERMPETFKHPSRQTEPGYTVYQAAVGEDTLLRLTDKTTFGQITDGTSNTVMLVEATAERAVPWTKPDDYEVDVDDPKAGLFVDGMTQVLMGDGSVQTLADSIAEEVMNALFTRAGGEVVNPF